MNPPGRIAHIHDPMAYTLGQFHLVHVVFAVDGSEKLWETVSPNDSFQRDDIDNADVLRAYVRHTVTPVLRRMYRSSDVGLLNWNGHTRITAPGVPIDAFLVGFCETFCQAATWVHNGLGRAFLPWDRR